MVRNIVIDNLEYEVPLYLRRLECPKSKAWQVAINKKEFKYSKLFSDKINGGTLNAFNNALEHIETIVKEHDLDRGSRKIDHYISMKNGHHSTGIRGVTIFLTEYHHKMRMYVGLQLNNVKNIYIGTSGNVNRNKLRKVLDESCRKRYIYEKVTDAEIGRDYRISRQHLDLIIDLHRHHLREEL